MLNRNLKILFIFFWIASTFSGCEHNSNNIASQQIKNESAQVQPSSKSTGIDQTNTANVDSPSDSSPNTANQIKITFIELGSVNCIPCRMMQPVMEQIEKKYSGQVKVVFYDVWTQEGQPFGQKYGISAIPTQVFLDENGAEFFRHSGFFPLDEIEKIFKTKGIK
ncbi:MAG TPA: thioredoxin family protein [bacterium]|mgnify:CR=1 FL=1|nr:thioredoxin family protein [bacterium]HPN29937.1 thioredoxin family protein [bacterium]